MHLHWNDRILSWILTSLFPKVSSGRVNGRQQGYTMSARIGTILNRCWRYIQGRWCMMLWTFSVTRPRFTCYGSKEYVANEIQPGVSTLRRAVLGEKQNSSRNLKILVGIGRLKVSHKVKILGSLRFFGNVSQKFGMIFQIFRGLLFMVLLKQRLPELPPSVIEN